MVSYKHSKKGDLKFSVNGKNWQRVYSQTKCSKVKVSAAFSKLVRSKPKVNFPKNFQFVYNGKSGRFLQPKGQALKKLTK